MTIRFSKLFGPVLFIAVSLGAHAQGIFSTGANVPVTATFYRNSGGTLDTGTSYFVLGNFGTFGGPATHPAGYIVPLAFENFSDLISADSSDNFTTFTQVRARLNDGSFYRAASNGNIELDIYAARHPPSLMTPFRFASLSPRL